MATTSLERSRRARRTADACREDAERCCKAARAEGERSIRLKWRARQLKFDRRGPIAAMYEAGNEDRVHSRRLNPVSSGQAEEAAVPTEVSEKLQEIRDGVIRGLFHVTLELGTALELIRDPDARDRIGNLIGKTDALIREVRAAVIDAIPPDGAPFRPKRKAFD